MQETRVWPLGLGDPMAKKMAIHSSVLAWEIPWTEEPGGLQSATAAAKSLQSCPTLCNSIDGRPPGSPTPGILQARTLEWVAIFFSNAWKWKVKVKSFSCVRLCDPIDGSPPGSPVPGILQARTLEWIAIFFSNAWKWKVKLKSLSHIGLFATPQTLAYQAPPSMGFTKQEYWSGVPLPSPFQHSRGIE